MAVGARGELVAANDVGCPVVVDVVPFWIGKKGSYVGKKTCVGEAGAHEASRVAERNKAERNLFKDMGAILPVDNCKLRK